MITGTEVLAGIGLFTLVLAGSAIVGCIIWLIQIILNNQQDIIALNRQIDGYRKAIASAGLVLFTNGTYCLGHEWYTNVKKVRKK